LVQFLLTVVLSIEERFFLVEYIFREGNRYSDLVQQKLVEKFPQTAVPYRKAVRRLIEKCRVTGSWTSLPLPFISAQRLSERRVAENICE
jgi:hypothetical protein